MNQIATLLTTAPAADGARPDSPATGETGGDAAFTRLLHSARSTTAPATATDSLPPDAASLAELLRQVPAVDGKELPPLATEDLSAATARSEAGKLPDTVVSDTAVPVPVAAALLPPAPSMPSIPVTPSETNVSAAAVIPETIDKAVKAAGGPDTKPSMPSALPQGVDVRQQPGGKFDAAALDPAASQPSGTDRQTAVSPLLTSAAEQRVAGERAVRAPVSADAPISVQTPVDAMRQLAAVMPDAATRASAPAPMPVPPDHPQWGQNFGERVVWLVNQRATSAQLSLNPPDLGRLDVRINLNQDQARVLFATPHESVREAIEAAVPRLREMLADSGVQLLDVGIERHAGGRQPHPFQTPSSLRDHSAGDSAVAAESPTTPASGGVGLVDTFA